MLEHMLRQIVNNENVNINMSAFVIFVFALNKISDLNKININLRSSAGLLPGC